MKMNTDFTDNLVNIQAESKKPPEPTTEPPLTQLHSEGRRKLRSWLNLQMRIEMTDGRTLIGSFVCTDKDNNIILTACSEHLPPDDDGKEDEPRILGLAMVPGRHVVSISVESKQPAEHLCTPPPSYA